MVQELRRFRASIEASQAREDSFMGRKHLVVPVIALVQGVIHPSNASNPELALAQDFGKVPSGWNGRPLVMDHPQVDGQPSEANSPSILEDYQFGFIFNTHVDGDKLKTEAWIDLDRVHELGGDFEETVQRINDGEVVEVSTGFFADIDTVRGTYANKRYNGVYRNFVPDHLAFLPEGKTGACSVEGGCGAPRLNSSGGTSWPKSVTGKAQEASLRVNRPKVSAKPSAKVAKAKCQCENHQGKCQCEESEDDVARLASATPSSTSKPPVYRSTALQSLGEPPVSTVELFQRVSQLFAATIPDAVLDSDVRRSLCHACQELYGPYVYVVGFTQSTVIYVGYDDGCYRQVSFDMDADGNIDFTSEPQEVRLMTRIVAVQSPGGSQTSDGNSPPVGAGSTTPSTQAGDPSGEPTTEEGWEGSSSEDPATQTQEDSMSETTKPGAGSEKKPEAAPVTPVVVVQPVLPAPVETPIAPITAPAVVAVPAPTTPQTLEQYIAAAPNELRESLAEGFRLQSERKTALIQQLKSTNRCDFAEEDLMKMPLSQLESFAKLAGVQTETAAPATFEGRATPQPVAYAAGQPKNEFFAPPPPLVFPPKEVKQAS